MNKIAILSDVHTNLPVLEAVLRDVEFSGAVKIVFLGDFVGYDASLSNILLAIILPGNSTTASAGFFSKQHPLI